MPDLTKHLTRAKQLFDKGACDDALTILGECIEVDPANVEIFKLLIPISRRKRCTRLRFTFSPRLANKGTRRLLPDVGSLR